MNLTFTYRNLDSSDALEEKVRSGLKKIRKLIDSTIDVHCIFSVEGHRHEVELNVRGAGRDFSARDVDDDMYKAAGKAVLKLEKQITRHFSKLRTH